jgi:hypothetical protein
MMRRRLRILITAFNEAVSTYTLARLEIAVGHPRIAAPPVIDRLGRGLIVPGADAGRTWRTAIRQVHAADVYVKTGASAVARRNEAWSRLADSFRRLKGHAASIEALHAMMARARRQRGS